MRQNFQVLIFPLRKEGASVEVCIFQRRDDPTIWQGVSGGGEKEETFMEAAQRELEEETGLKHAALLPLQTKGSIPIHFFPALAASFPNDYVVSEYAFVAVAKESQIRLSEEHLSYQWCSINEAVTKVSFDSNRTALYEIRSRLDKKQLPI